MPGKFEEIEEKIETKPVEAKNKKKEQKPKYKVVKELPMQQIRQAKEEDGSLTTFITIEEALQSLIGGDL